MAEDREPTEASCGADHCFLPHDDVTCFVDDAWCSKVYSPTPRPEAKGHEALLVGYGVDLVTISTEFGNHRATVEIPTATFDFLIEQVRGGAFEGAHR